MKNGWYGTIPSHPIFIMLNSLGANGNLRFPQKPSVVNLQSNNNVKKEDARFSQHP
jgi:hypothetical protein